MCMCSQEGFLDLKNKKYMVLLRLTWAGLSSSLPLPLLLSSSVHWEAKSRATPGSPEGNTEGPGTASSEPPLPS